jgi:formamidopyrimidine-DNA glycosylase
MPELPEVETIARGVDRRVRGDQIVQAWFSSFPQPFKTPAGRQAKGLEGRWILAVHRTGKHIVCELGPRPGAGTQPDAQWIVHLGMKSGREIRFVDPRRFGRLEFRTLSTTGGFESAGREPLTIRAEEFAAVFRGRKLAIKAALLNQKLLTGIGNIYADESLFRAGIRPRRAAGRLTRAELERLRLALGEVLEHAIRLGGSSVSDYVDADGVRGFFQLEHCVYLRTGLPCPTCATLIQRILVAGRGTHYCPRCQN